LESILVWSGDRLEALAAFLRERSAEYPWLTVFAGACLLVWLVVHLITPFVRVLWWKFVCWRNRQMGKLMHWSYDSDVADAIVAITMRYAASGRLSRKDAKHKLQVLGKALNLPELHPVLKYYRPLHPFRVEQLREKTVAALGGKAAADAKLKEQRAKKARAAVKLTVVGGTSKVA
jgi:hypothetical protein